MPRFDPPGSVPPGSVPPASADAAPLEIRIRRATRCLEVDFEDGLRAVFPAEYLRVESPSAEVQGHGPGQAVLVYGKRDVGVETVDPIGHYAVCVRFTDGHDTGIYTWSYLHQLAHEQPARWEAYLAALAVAGRSRDPAPAPRFGARR